MLLQIQQKQFQINHNSFFRIRSRSIFPLENKENMRKKIKEEHRKEERKIPVVETPHHLQFSF